MEKQKVIVYVDGYNFYYGLKHGGSKWKRLYWLDVVKFFERMMLPEQELVEGLGHYKARFVQSMLPDEVTLSNGHILQRPDNWR